MPWESKIRGLDNGMVEKIRQRVVLSLRRQRARSPRQQSSALSRAELSRGEQRRSRGVAQESWTDALGEQDSRLGQWNG